MEPTTNDPLLLALPDLLATQPDLLSAADWQDLQQTLDIIADAPPADAESILREWCKQRTALRDSLMESAREIGQIKRSETAKPRLSNYFQELRDIVRQRAQQPPKSS